MNVKRLVRNLLRSIGYDIKRYTPGQFGLDPFEDMSRFLRQQKRPVIFDVGANVGQSVDNFRKEFPDSLIHSFEPSPSTYARLLAHCRGLDGVQTWNYGVGSRAATLPFLENTHSDMSSFLAPDELCWGSIAKTSDVKVLTLDSFASEQGIEFIDVLKSDAQGYEFEVFKGAEGLIKQNRIGLIYFEFIFSNQYKGLPSFSEVFAFLAERNFSLVTFYQPYFQEDLISWTDVLFINNEFRQRVRNDAAGGTLRITAA